MLPSPPLPPICVALSGDDMADRARRLVPEFLFFEFRLDTAADPHAALFAMGALLRARPDVCAIATCRRAANGGSFKGTAADEIDLLRQAAAVGASIVDLSLETAEEAAINPHALAPLRRANARLLLSWHDFQNTPPLEPVLDRMRRIGADLYKIVPTAATLTDSLRLFDLLEAHGAGGNLIAMSMGLPGVLTRVLGPRFGSLFTFASAVTGAETAPGQVDARTLRDLYRLPSITSQTEIYGVFGQPIGGSRSPVMHNTAFRTTGRDAVYLPLETSSADGVCQTLQRLRMRGASITMPLKEAVVEHLTQVSANARALGAVNTVTRDRDDALDGTNTDVSGIIEPLLQRTSLDGQHALVLGAGGVARAAVFALRQRHCRVSLVNRSRDRAEQLARELGAEVLDAAELPGSHFDLILNATPYGMPNSTMAAPVDFSKLACDLFFELVYSPVETPLVQAARSRGIPVILGVEMFLSQGAAQFSRWTGDSAPVEVMRRAVLKSLA